MTEEIKRIDIKEFREKGYLQEANRLFFHPIGLALEVIIEEDGNESLGGVWDYRDDEEGNFFGDSMIKEEKIEHVRELKDSKIRNRIAAMQIHDNILVDDNGIQLKDFGNENRS